ncbi:MAG: TetR/AcrR family transcriptional regulator [Cellulosilyticaceae bacterium]
MSREEKNAKSREKILQAAIEEFGQKDYGMASTNSMCKNHQLSKGLLFHYYKNKEELFLICVQKTFDALSEYLEEHYKEVQETIDERLNAYFAVRFKFFEENPYYRQIFNTALLNPPEELISQIEILKTNLNETNKKYILSILEGVELREGIERDEVVDIIKDFGSYLQSKHRNNYFEHPEDKEAIIEAHNKSVKTLISIVFYGIVNK